jgi:arylsulfatase A-like enzyme
MAWHRAYDPKGIHLDQIHNSGTKYKHQNYDRSPEDLKKWHTAFLPKNEAYYKAGYNEKDMVRWKYQRYMKNYLRCVKSVDDNVGRLLNYLDESGLDQNTVVIYSSDQGFFLGEHGWFDKRWAYEPSVKAPLLVRWPGIAPPNSTSHQIVSNLDFAQTMLDIAGANIPEDMQGKSIVPLLKGKQPDNWRKHHYYQYFEGDINNPKRSNHHVPRHSSVIGERYKLIHYYQLDEWELFDLERDPDEMKNQYDNPELKQVRDELKNQLSKLRQQYLVPDQDPIGAGIKKHHH